VDRDKHLHSEEEPVLPGTCLGAIRDVAFNKSSQAQVTPAHSPDLGPEVRECIQREVAPSAGISGGSANARQDDELILVVLVAFAARIAPEPGIKQVRQLSDAICRHSGGKRRSERELPGIHLRRTGMDRGPVSQELGP
jgi:hypothetical protein